MTRLLPYGHWRHQHRPLPAHAPMALATQHRKATSTAMAPSPADAAIALRLAASGAHNDAADVSGDGHVTSLDARMIMQAAAGRIEL